MTFKEAYMKLLAGYKIKRPNWEGYWFMSDVNGKLNIKLANGDIITEGDLTLTVANTLADDWIIYEGDK